jgi:DNA-directed RNA polymerase subunit RPC12/RpoP
MSELFVCQNCEDANRDPVVNLDRRLRCEACGSDAVVSLERVLHAARPAGARRRETRFVLIGRTV